MKPGTVMAGILEIVLTRFDPAGRLAVGILIRSSDGFVRFNPEGPSMHIRAYETTIVLVFSIYWSFYRPALDSEQMWHQMRRS